MVDSKIFVGLRPTRKKPASLSKSTGPTCQWDGCDGNGLHRAPVGRGAEGLYLLFCLEHVKEYNRGYNYAADLSNPETARYQREATSGVRQAWGTVVNASNATPMPSTGPSGSAKALNARKSAAQRLAHNTGSGAKTQSAGSKGL